MGNNVSTPAKIVLIEDNPSDVYLMQLALVESGLAFELTNFQSGADALVILCPSVSACQDALVPDLILLDLNTPRCDGFEVLVTIRSNKRLSCVPVAVVTSSGCPTDIKRATLSGATRYIQKPSDLGDFLTRMGNAIREMLAVRPDSPELGMGAGLVL